MVAAAVAADTDDAEVVGVRTGLGGCLENRLEGEDFLGKGLREEDDMVWDEVGVTVGTRKEVWEEERLRREAVAMDSVRIQGRIVFWLG